MTDNKVNVFGKAIQGLAANNLRATRNERTPFDINSAFGKLGMTFANGGFGGQNNE